MNEDKQKELAEYNEKLKKARIDGVVLYVLCTGEAHSPEVAGGIDHCMICVPYWERYPICPHCESKVQLNTRKNKATYKYKCKRCKVLIHDNPDKTCVNERTH